MFEHFWYVINNLNEVEFYEVIPIILGIFIIIGLLSFVKWVIKKIWNRE
jgi:hypothetical protein